MDQETIPCGACAGSTRGPLDGENGHGAEAHERIETLCIHAGYSETDAASNHWSLSVPIYETSTFIFPSSDALVKTVRGEQGNYLYSRCGNPTICYAERRLATLEKTEDAVLFSSGMAAVSSCFWTFLGQGAHLICSTLIYGCTMALVRTGLRRFGVDVSFVDTADTEAVKAALRPDTRMVFFEVVANPVLTVADVRAISEAAHRANPECLVIADATFTPPVMCRPVEFGANMVVHSLTKAMVGTGTCLGGCVCGRAADMARLRSDGRTFLTGGVCDPQAAAQLLNGLKTLPVRIERHSQTADCVIEWLQTELERGRIAKLYAPSIPGAPYHELYERQCKGTCAVVSFELASFKQAEAFLDSLRLCRRAVSLGDAETLVTIPGVSTHAGYTAEQRAEYGILDSLIRLSVGLENCKDIIADLSQALDASEKAL